MEVKKAVIPAAGFGTRFLPATKAQPKEMLPIINKPTIHFVVEEIIKSGIEDVLIVTGRGKRAIEDYFDKNVELEDHLRRIGKRDLLREMQELSDMVDIHYVRQKKQLGLGHAILCAERHIDGEPFAVLLGDTIVRSEVPCTKQGIELFRKYGGSMVGVERVKREDIERYGIVGGVRRGEVFEVDKLVEKPKPEEAPSNLGIIGRYVLTPTIFDALKETKEGIGGEIQLTDAISVLLGGEKVYAYEVAGSRYDIGNKLDYLRAVVEFGIRDEEIGEEFKRYLRGIIR